MTLGRGVHRIRETFGYTCKQQAATWDIDAMTDASHSVVFLLAVHCATACYGRYQAEVAHLMSSVTASSLGRPTGPLAGLIGR